MEISNPELIEEGKNIVKINSFYNTLYLLLKYYFVRPIELNMMTFIKDVTNTENEFKVFMVYIDYAIYIHNNIFINIKYDNNEDMIYALISYIKKSYDNDRNVLKPFIHSVTENESEIIEKFNIVKSTYNFKKDAMDKFDQLNKAIIYLEKAREYEDESKKYSNMAVQILTNLKSQFRNTIYNQELPRLMIQNK